METRNVTRAETGVRANEWIYRLWFKNLKLSRLSSLRSCP
jgi:hypothetical protein